MLGIRYQFLSVGMENPVTILNIVTYDSSYVGRTRPLRPIPYLSLFLLYILHLKSLWLYLAIRLDKVRSKAFFCNGHGHLLMNSSTTENKGNLLYHRENCHIHRAPRSTFHLKIYYNFLRVAHFH